MPSARRDVLSHGSEAYAPRSSGLLRGGGGISRYRRRRSAIKGWGKNFPDKMMTDLRAIKEGVPDFDPALEFDYTRRELSLMAEKILLVDERPLGEYPMVLNAPSYRYRIKHEIYTEAGTPDPSIVEGMYWRTHPQGRRWSTPELMRTTGCGFYDGVQDTDLEIVPEPPPPELKEDIMCVGPECDKRAVGKKNRLCPGHQTQFYAGKPLTPLRARIDADRIRAIKDSWDSGETNVDVGRRLGVGAKTVAKYRSMGQVEALREISSGRA